MIGACDNCGKQNVPVKHYSETYCGETTQCFICTGWDEPDPYGEIEEEKPSQKPDFQRFAFVIQADHRGIPSTTEWNAHASQQEIAQALCDNDLPDYPVVRIIECNPFEGWSRDVTEDVARLIPAICDTAEREGLNVQACALDLMSRYIKVRKLEAA